MIRADRLITDCRLATMAEGVEPYGAVEDGAILIRNGDIVWVGAGADLPPHHAVETDRLDGRWVTPGLIDCHTHLVFGGDRSGEFEQRLGGATYEEIARAGGGIVSSVRMTREASEDDLVASALKRLAGLKASGVTTVEIKSGYGLDRDSELKMLRAAHGGGLVDAVDAYCEPIAFSRDEVARLFDRATALGLPVKLHADQLSNGGGAALAARYGALSADHVEHADEAGIAAMAEAGVVAVLLPGAFLMLREETPPPIEALRGHGVAMAVATDCNPGTSPVASLLAALTLACVQFRLTPEEALTGATRHAAKALGLADRIGALEPGKAADLAVWDINRPAELCYWLGAPLLHRRYLAGRPD